jgi:hypothetical protein
LVDEGFYPLSMITLMVGEAGEGKSFLTTWIASMVSTEGNKFRNHVIPTGKVILGNSEDSASSTIKPRLEMNGANMNNVCDMPTITRKATTRDGKVEYENSITLDSIRDLRKVLDKLPGCRLVIFDPVSAFWGEVNENKNPQVRVTMKQLMKVAEDYAVAIVLVTHYNKGLGSQALARITGSNALAASSRAVWSITNNKETNIRTVACAKFNISENRQGFTFEIVDGKIRILENYVDVTADQMLYERMISNQKKPGPEPKKMLACCDWLREFLASRTVPANEVYQKALEAGHAKDTILEAKKVLGIKHKKKGFSGTWFWTIPPNSQDNSCAETNYPIFEERVVNSENYPIFEQSLENTGLESKNFQENPEDRVVSSIHIENYPIFEENEPISPTSTVKTNCGKDGNSATEITNKTTVAAHCGKPEKSTKKPKKEGDMIITTTVAEMEERVNEMLEQRMTTTLSKKEQTNQQTEEKETFRKTGSKK